MYLKPVWCSSWGFRLCCVAHYQVFFFLFLSIEVTVSFFSESIDGNNSSETLYAPLGYTTSLYFEFTFSGSHGDLLNDVHWFMGLPTVKAMYGYGKHLPEGQSLSMAWRANVYWKSWDSFFLVMGKLIDRRKYIDQVKVLLKKVSVWRAAKWPYTGHIFRVGSAQQTSSLCWVVICSLYSFKM